MTASVRQIITNPGWLQPLPITTVQYQPIRVELIVIINDPPTRTWSWMERISNQLLFQLDDEGKQNTASPDEMPALQPTMTFDTESANLNDHWRYSRQKLVPNDRNPTKCDSARGSDLVTEDLITAYCELHERFPLGGLHYPKARLSEWPSTAWTCNQSDSLSPPSDEGDSSMDAVLCAGADEDQRIPSTVADWPACSSSSPIADDTSSNGDSSPFDEDPRSPVSVTSPPPSPPVLPPRRTRRRSSTRRQAEKPCGHGSSKQPLLWEFLLKTLDNTLYNPKYITWLDRNLGTFKFVQSKKIAQLWGERRERSDMSYEFFSRALRHHYKRDVIRRVQGKRLQYQFLSNASGWQEVAANSPS